MTTLVPLLLGCSGFALGLPGSPGVVGLIALGDVRVRWDGLPLIVDFGAAGVQLGTAAGRWIWPLCFYRCVLLLHISVQCGHWCVVVVCTGGCGGACSSCVPVFGVCWVYSGPCWWGLVSVDTDVFQCGWCDRSWVGPWGCSVDMEHLSACYLVIDFLFPFPINFIRVHCNLGL